MNAIKQYIGGAIVSTALAIGTVGSVQAQVGTTLAQATPATPSVGLGTDPKPGLTMSAKQAEEFERIYLLGPDARKEAVKGLPRDKRIELTEYILDKEEQARIKEENRLADTTTARINLSKKADIIEKETDTMVAYTMITSHALFISNCIHLNVSCSLVTPDNPPAWDRLEKDLNVLKIPNTPYIIATLKDIVLEKGKIGESNHVPILKKYITYVKDMNLTSTAIANQLQRAERVLMSMGKSPEYIATDIKDRELVAKSVQANIKTS